MRNSFARWGALGGLGFMATAGLLLGACGGPVQVTCDQDDQCGAGFSCIDGSCAKKDGVPSGGGNNNPGGNQGGNIDPTCAVAKSQAALVRKPVDVIFVIDNSPSMRQEIASVKQNIDVNFAKIMENPPAGQAKVDYRVVLVSLYGDTATLFTHPVCITAPLSGNGNCDPAPAVPVNTARFFHYSAKINSRDSFQKILDTYNRPDEFNLAPKGWSQWLRPDAYKVFVEITDDDEEESASWFESRLFALKPAHFGTAARRNYLMHAIAGMDPKAGNPDNAYLPNEPLQNTTCDLSASGGGKAMRPGLNYQNLAKSTGGLRFSVCYERFDTVFKRIAEGIVSGTQVACEFAVPPPPQGHTISERIRVDFTPGSGQGVSFSQIKNPAECGASSFYVDSGKVVLCPASCDVVRADPAGKVEVAFTCEPGQIN